MGWASGPGPIHHPSYKTSFSSFKNPCATNRLPSKTTHSFPSPSQCSSKVHLCVFRDYKLLNSLDFDPARVSPLSTMLEMHAFLMWWLLNLLQRLHTC
ncbi:hypothetical protein V6N13_011625 [Hibiscus sabdariffa]